MLTKCDRCGREIDPEDAGLDVCGSPICRHCADRERGHREAEKALHSQALRFALYHAAMDQGLDWVRQEVADLLDVVERSDRRLDEVWG